MKTNYMKTNYTTTRGESKELSPSAVEGLEATLRGALIRADDPRYEEARAVYNAMIDRRPGLIARCVDAADVIGGVRFAREHDALLAVRGGGHNGAGLAVCDGGLVLDLSPMKGIRVDPEARTVRVQAGCTWGDVDHATQAFGLAVPSGIISTTGVAGLTLGGGHGYLSRRYGLTIDSLLAADVVLADGRAVTASAKENPDLFWALRGGGGNFGVVTSFLFRAHPVGEVQAGPTFWPIERTAEVLRWYQEFTAEAPEELYGFFAVMTVPPAPPFPEELHGRKVCSVMWCHLGTPEEAERALRPVLAVGPPLLHHVEAMPYAALQSAFDALYPPGLQWYWKGDFVRELSDEAIDLHAELGAALPSMHSTMHLYPIDGAVHRVAQDATAFGHRDVRWSKVIAGVDPDPDNTSRCIEWARRYWEALHPHTAGGAYVNFMMQEGDDRVRATYRGNHQRLAEVKRRHDPDNLFRVNQNIGPA